MVEKQARGRKGHGQCIPYKGGGWRARLTIKGVTKTKVVSTYDEGMDLIAEWRKASQGGKLVAGTKMTLADCIRIWLAHEDTDLTISTAQGYQQKVDAYISWSPLYNKRLDQISAQEIRKFVRSLENGEFAAEKIRSIDKQIKAIRSQPANKKDELLDGARVTALEAKKPKKVTQYSSSVQRQCYAVIRSALNWAADPDRRYVSHNVAVEVKLDGAKTNVERDAARLSKEEVEHGYVLGPDQFQDILAAIKNDRRTYAMRLLQVDLGLRPGEYLGICVNDIDFDNNILHVRRQIQHETGVGTIIVDRVKTDSGERSIHLPQYIADALQRRIADRGRDIERRNHPKHHEFNGHKYELLFTQSSGKPISQRLDATWWAKRLTTPKDKGGAGFAKPVRRYVARHHAASAMVAANDADILVISTTLGHSDPSFTLKRYGHALDEKKAAMAAKMNARNANRVYEYREAVLDREAGRLDMNEEQLALRGHYSELAAEQQSEQDRLWDERIKKAAAALTP